MANNKKMKSNELIITRGINFKFNPFGGIGDDELSKILVPNRQLSSIIQDIKNEQIKIIELVGKKGRGKTSHLKFLHQLFPKGRLILLNSKNLEKDIIKNENKIIFIDSIHHINLLQRLQLYKTNKKIILTTHSSRVLEFIISNQAYRSYSIKGIANTILVQILKNRISFSSDVDCNNIELNKEEVDRLIFKHKDNYRGILNYLFDNHGND